MNTVIYVDRNLMIAIATKLVGLLREESHGTASGLGLNWLIQGTTSADTRHGISRDVRELLPEDVLYSIYNSIKNRYADVPTCVNAMAEVGTKQFLPGGIISVQGILSFPSLQIPQYDPFSPPTIQMPVFSVHGENCFVGRISNDGFTLPVYFSETAKEQVCFCNSEPVEIIGILRWSPPYRPDGSKSLTKIIRSAAVLLR